MSAPKIITCTLQLTPGANGRWNERLLYSFGSKKDDGLAPSSRLIFDTAGNLYGTTGAGGTHYCGTRDSGIYNCGTVFEITP